MTCVTCGDEILHERAELGFTYCTKKECVRANGKGYTVVEIAQNKTNAEYVVLDGAAGERALKDMAEGKYRRDPVVVKRQSAAAKFDAPKVRFRKPRMQRPQPNRVKFVQALQAQGLGVDEIVRRGAYMNLTRAEVVAYMSARRRG
jgi:hypothetical protein